MGIFYALETEAQPAPAGGLPSGDEGQRPPSRPMGRSPKLQNERLIFAIMLLLFILGAGITTHQLRMAEWSTVLLHSFELCVGGVLGILTGEAASHA
jgi:hypothetical protein